MKNKSHYFKLGFITSVPIAVFTIIYDLLRLDFFESSPILMLIAKGLITGLVTGLILGFLNTFVKYDLLRENEEE